MRRIKNLLCLGMIGLASLLPTKSIAEVNISSDINFLSRYMFFGIPFSKESVNQSMINLNKGDFTGILWENYDAEQKKVNEIDVFADYTKSVKNKLKVSLGVIYFRAKVGNNWEDCIDWYAGACATDIPLSPSITCHKFTGSGSYVESGILRDFPFSKKITATASGKLGYNDKAFREKTGFSHLETNLKISVKLSKKLSVIPNINYSRALADDLDNIT